jgi:LCP family protein required for cell wall assembly
VPTSVLTQDLIHILLIGGDTDYVMDMNTDTLVVAVVDRSTGQVSLLSIPRDLWVYIPTYGWGRINIAHRWGQRTGYTDGKGPGLLKRTVEENLGIPIDYWVRVGYDGFAKAVDALGGVDMVVPCRINLSYQPGDPPRILEAGVHHMDGPTALRYVRTRLGDSDYERAGRQQAFMKAVWSQVEDTDIRLKIPALWWALKDHFRTDLKLGDALALAPVVLDLEPRRVRSRYIGRAQVQGWTTEDGARVLLPIPEKVQQVVAGLYAPPPSGGEGEAEQLARVEVRNGTERPELGLIAADQLRWEGFQVVDAAPADRSDYRRTKLVVYNDRPGMVEKLSWTLGVRARDVTYEPDPNHAADLRVILGAAYDPCR